MQQVPWPASQLRAARNFAIPFRWPQRQGNEGGCTRRSHWIAGKKSPGLRLRCDSRRIPQTIPEGAGILTASSASSCIRELRESTVQDLGYGDPQSFPAEAVAGLGLKHSGHKVYAFRYWVIGGSVLLPCACRARTGKGVGGSTEGCELCTFGQTRAGSEERSRAAETSLWKFRPPLRAAGVLLEAHDSWAVSNRVETTWQLGLAAP